MSSTITLKSSFVRAAIFMALLLGMILVSGCVSEPEVCDYDAICLQNETDNCADCKDVLGRDVKDPTGNVIYIDNNV